MSKTYNEYENVSPNKIRELFSLAFESKEYIKDMNKEIGA